MTSKRLIGIGDTIIMNSNNRSISTHSISSPLDKSMKSIKSVRTNSTNETRRKDSSDNYQDFMSSDCISNNNILTDGRLSIDSNFIASNEISKREINKSLKKYLKTEPNKVATSADLLNNADQILKGRKGNFPLYNQLVKSVFMKKTKEICLDNYKIKLMSEKRNELNTKKDVISNALKANEKIFEQDYKRFLEFVEDTNNSFKRQEYLLNKYKRIIDEKETEFNKQNLVNKKLKEDIEFIVRRILTLRYYGSFIHNVFKIDFVYENIKRTEGKNLLNVAEDIIKTYEINNEKGYDDKLLDEYWLMAQVNEFENNIISLLNEKESFKKEIIKIEYDDKEEIERLKESIIQLEKRLAIAEEEKNKFLKTIMTYENPEIMDTVLDCIEELTHILELNTASSAILLKDKTITNYTVLSSSLMKIVKEKEKEVINHIEEINNVINGENNEDRLLIEEIITDRRKSIKKRKLFELLKIQKDELMKKNMKAVERANRIIIKGRKVPDFPQIKIKNKKKKVVIDKKDDDIIYYSSSSDESQESII